MIELRSDWKRAVIDDLRNWLDEIPDDTSPSMSGDSGESPTDLRSVFAELASLTQEVKLQTREHARSVRELQRATDGQEKLVEILTRHQDRVTQRETSQLELDARQQADREQQSHLALLRVHDALVRGRQSSAAVAELRGGFLTRVPAGIAGICIGYDLALERLHHALSTLGIERVVTVGKRFDPARMVATDVCVVADLQDELVLEEHLSGFLHKGRVLRLAEVVVGRSAPTNT